MSLPTPSSPFPRPPFQPEVFGDFLLVQRLAESNLAEALIGVRLGDRRGRTFVIKRPRLGERASGAAAQAIAREGEVLQDVRSSHLVALEAAGELSGLPYVAVEHVRGAPLDALLSHHRQLSDGVTAAIAHDLAAALRALHAAGWMHGDIAPSNVLVDEAGEVRLADFGIAARIGARRHDLAGKPGYIAPEVLHATTAEASADIYGWGVIVAECATGRRLFVERDLTDAASRSPAVDASGLGVWSELVQSALSRDPNGRPSADELASALQAHRAERGELAALVAQSMLDPPRERASAIEPRQLTPTAPTVGVGPTIVDADEPVDVTDVVAGGLRAPALRARGASPRTGGGKSWWPTVVVVAVVAALVGGVVGRRSVRPRGGGVTFAGLVPDQAVVELDGERVDPPAVGDTLPVAPGRHVLVVRLPNKRVQEVPFTVQPGETIVLVPLTPRRR